MHRVEHLFEMGAPAGIRIDKGKAVSPTHIRVLNMLGMSIGSAAYNQDALTQLYHFQEKKRYDTLGIDRQIYKKLMVGDHQGALDIIRETDRYTTLEGAVEAMKKFQNPAKALWANMGIKDKRTFLDTLSESDAVKFQEDIQEERIE